MKPIKVYSIIVVSFFLTFQTTSGIADTLGISPIRIYLTPEQSITSLVIKNKTDRAIFVQTEPVVWSQVDGRESYEPTPDIIVSPPIFEIDAQKSRVIRLAVNSDADITVEKSYRLFVSEIPLNESKDAPGIKFSIRLGLPIFLTPDQAKPALTWKAQVNCNGKLHISANNLGTAHQLITKLSITSIENNILLSELVSPGYIFPSSMKEWELDINKDNIPSQFTVQFQDGVGIISRRNLTQESISC